MEDRMRAQENKVGTLEEWRRSTVDPHIMRAEPFMPKVSEFIATFKAVEEERKEARQAERELRDIQHKQNIERSNLQLILLTVALVFGTMILIFLGWLTYQATKQHALLPLSSIATQTAEESAIPIWR